jgi:WD40 repeat protein
MTSVRSLCLFVAIIGAIGCANDPLSGVSPRDGARPDEGAEPRPSGAATDGTPIRSWDDCGAISLADNEPKRPRVVGIAVSPDARWLVATTGRQAYVVRVSSPFNASPLERMLDVSVAVYPAFTPDTAGVAISGDPPAVFDVVSGNRLFEPEPPPPAVIAGCWMAFVAVSQRLVWVAESGYRNEARVYAPGTAAPQPLAVLPSSSCTAEAVFSADDTLLATGVPELYRTSDWKRLWPSKLAPVSDGSLDSSSLDSVTFTPDGLRILSSKCVVANGQFGACHNQFFSVASGAPVGGQLPFEGGRPSFAPDGHWLVAGGDVYAPDSGELRHLGEFTAAAFSTAGDIYAASADGVIKRLCAIR